MTEEDRYLFDLQGYLVISNAIEPQALTRMNDWLDEHAKEDPRWEGQTGNLHLEYPITWGPDFFALLDNPLVLPILQELLGDTMRLDHDYAIFLKDGHEGMPIHGPNLCEPYDPINFYQCVDSRIYCGLTVAGYALSDVPPGAGGLAVIPGSHKSNFRVPEEIRCHVRPSPVVQQVPTRAGDCVLFTERLFHGTLPWKGPGIRRTLFLKYAPGGISWSNLTYLPPRGIPAMQEMEKDLSPMQRQLLMPACADDHRRVRR